MIVTVYSTSGKNNVKIETSATTFGELKPFLREQGFSLDGMKAVVGETKVTLEADAAILPETDFKLFLMPFKTKSGVDIQGLDRLGVYSEIQRLITRDGDSAKEHFNQHGNYTRTKTSDLKTLLEEYEPTTTPISADTPISNDGDMILVSKSRLEASLEKLLDIDSYDLTGSDEDKLNEVTDDLQDIIDNSDTTDVVPTDSTRELSPEELKAKEEREQKRLEKEALDNEANELKNMFPDVR